MHSPVLAPVQGMPSTSGRAGLPGMALGASGAGPTTQTPVAGSTTSPAMHSATGVGACEAGTPKALFMARTLPRSEQVQWEYDVTRDGQRFVMGSILDGPRAAPPAPTIVLNWMAAPKR